MSALSIIIAAVEDADYLRASAEAACDAAAALHMGAELLVVSSAEMERDVQRSLQGLPLRFCVSDESGAAALWNCGAASASGASLLFVREGVILTAEGLQKLLETLLLDEKIAAVGPLSNRTVFSWQYLKAEEMAAKGEDPSAWVRKHLTSPSESLFLEDFALLIRRSAFVQLHGFDEMFTGGGADLDLSFRLKYEGFYLLRVPVYLAHRGAGQCELFDLTRSEARLLLMERWGIDIGLPETILQQTLGTIVWAHNLPLIHATARTALLKAPLVSIMIPTYNRPEYFHETLESALAQTYPNIEVIVCDNSTNEHTAELMQAYRGDVRVRYVRNKNAHSKEENFMPFEHLAQGEFLQWCMDDDILLPDKITLMVDAFLSEPTAALVTSVRGIIDGNGDFIGQWTDVPPVYDTYSVFPGADLGHAMLAFCSNFLGEPSAVLFRRRDLTHHYWRAESRGYQTISDCAMWLELLEKGDAVIFSRPLSLFRQHDGQEGQLPDTIVLSRIEWRRLIEDYWRKRVFLTKEEDHRAVLRKLEEDRTQIAPLLSRVSPALRQEYEAALPDIHVIMMNRVEGCAPVRLDAPLQRLRARGIISLSGCTNPGDEGIELDEIGDLHDSIILLERAVIRPEPWLHDLLTAHAGRGNVLLQEIDDHPRITSAVEEGNFFCFRAVTALQTSTKYLADYLREFNPYIYIFENQLEQLPEKRTYDASTDRVTIFFGALNRRPDWEPLMPAINKAIRRYGDRLFFRVVSDHGFYEALQTKAKEFTGGVRDASIVAPYERYTAALHASDIALLPLRDTEFNRGKSDLKFIEAAGHGAAVLASPTVYAGSVRDGETGMICHSPKAFAEKLDLLIQRADLRRTIAENAYRYVAEHRLLDQHIDTYIAAYRELMQRREELERARSARVEKFFPHR